MEPIKSTAGAISVPNEKGEISMQKVKVHRYVSGKRPEYAPSSSSEEESEDVDFLELQKLKESSLQQEEDPRLRRHIERKCEKQGIEERLIRRRIDQPEISESSSEDDKMEICEVEKEDEDDEDLSDEEIERRRQILRQKVLVQKTEQSEVLEEDERLLSSEDDGEETSECEEYTDSEEEIEARLEPVFIRKKDRTTIIEHEREAAKRKHEEEAEMRKEAEERRKQTLKILEAEIRKEQVSEKIKEGCIDIENSEDNEIGYEAWKLREMQRNIRNKEEKEQREQEMLEIVRLRNLTEEERRQELRLNPKTITNKCVKKKYKYLQKYYHRGGFYLDKDDEIFKRNFATATLDDHYNKTILPKVMQVKNFGRSGRTKYTHLVDQDTTQFDSPWISETSQNIKFYSNQAAGVKNVFSRPGKSFC